MVIHQRRWLERHFATIVTDRLHPHPTTRHRAAALHIAVSQPSAGSPLDMAPDGT